MKIGLSGSKTYRLWTFRNFYGIIIEYDIITAIFRNEFHCKVWVSFECRNDCALKGRTINSCFQCYDKAEDIIESLVCRLQKRVVQELVVK